MNNMPFEVIFSVWIFVLLIIYIITYIKNQRNQYIEVKDVLLTSEELINHGKQIGKLHIISKKENVKNRLLYRLDKNFKDIQFIYLELIKDINKKKNLPKASEWLLDNFYIIELQYKQIRQNLESERKLKLNVLKTGELQGYPRIYSVALELISHTDGILDEENLIKFIKAYQSETILSIKEISSLSLMLTLALMEYVRNICKKIYAIQCKWDKVENINITNTEQIKKYFENINEIDSTYIEHLLRRIKKQFSKSNELIDILEKRLNYFGTSYKDILEKEYREQTSIRISIGNGIISLKSISNIDWNNIFEDLCLVESILREDPSKIYEKMDSQSRNYYIYEVQKMAKKLKTQEIYIAKKSVEYALNEYNNKNITKKSHVGYYIVDEGRKKIFESLGYKYKRKGLYLSSLKYYLLPISVLTFFLVFMFSYYAYVKGNLSISILVAIITLIPLSNVSISLFNWIFSKMFKPTFLPKIEYSNQIPEDKKTFVIIPTILSSEERVEQLINDLEIYYLSNRQKNLYFALLGDFKECDSNKLKEDYKIIEKGLNKISELNKKYAKGNQNIFYYFQRRRTFSKTQNKWMGWERKRGAIIEFNDLLLGNNNTSYFIVSDNISNLQNKIKYVITLDADTKLPIDTATRLVGTISHPLNSPIFNKDKNIVIEGYGIIQPRIIVDIESANSSLFTRVFAGQGGIDPYTTSVSDIYQDLFGEGIFTGKGIYDLKIFQTTLKNSIPDNTILSHDLLEGSYVRVGLCTDVLLIDGYPEKYSSYMKRLHRWVRGDWQIIKWLSYRKNNPISLLSKWKILDNLRRSLLSVNVFLIIILGLIVLPGNIFVWLGLSIFVLFLPIIMWIIESILYKRFKINKLRFNGNLITGIKGILYQSIFLFIFLPYEAFMMIDAVIRTLYRLYISKKNLLEWTTAFDAEKKMKNNLYSYIKMMKSSIIISIFTILFVYYFRYNNIGYAAFIGILWGISPIVAYLISRKDEKINEEIEEDDIKILRRIARKTWDYYETFADSKNNYLPPDNYQEFPYNGVAYRTSPTNIGFLLVSILSSRDLGYITTSKMLELLNKTISTIEKMKKWKGHLYNWYNTVTLEPLRPYFISTVDSGNFVAYLITLNEGLKQYLEKPIFDQSLIRGYKDTINLIQDENKKEVFLNEFNNIENINKVYLKSLVEKLSKARLKDKDKWIENSLKMVNSILYEYNKVIPSSDIQKVLKKEIKERDINVKLSLVELKDYYDDVLEVFCNNDIYKDLIILRDNVNKIINDINDFISRIEKLVKDTEFCPLYDYKKNLFSIGYNEEEKKLLDSYYDLLASESRITSYIAVARREVPQKHWFNLGRSLIFKDGYRCLASWTGTMFEYLMPAIVMKTYSNTLLDETYKTAIKVQKNYGLKRKVPWGISESGFFAFDINLNYQYKAFGVPFLGFKRGLVDDLVVSPYSTMLALRLSPSQVTKNIKRLIEEGLEGKYGFYEAIDYTINRLPANKSKGIVKSYMTHHQGMIFLSINNYLNEDIIINRFHSNLQMKCGEILLQERIPLRTIIAKEKENLLKYKIEKSKNEINVVRAYSKAELKNIKCNILTSGGYSVLFTNDGLGYSKKDNMFITRWRNDILTQKYGTFIYIKNTNNNEIWSSAFEPTKVEPDKYEVVFSNDKVVYNRVDNNIETKTEIVLLSEEYGEIRKVTLTNNSDKDVILEITSYMEIVGDDLQSDIAHPVFNNLFVKTYVIPEYEAILAYRRLKSNEQKPVWIVHTIKDKNNDLSGFQYETNRMNFVGRGKDVSNPDAISKGLSNSVGVILDPIMSLNKRVKVKAQQSVEICFVTGIAQTKEEAIRLVRKYKDEINFSRAFDLAYTRSQTEIGYFNFTSDQIKFYDEILPNLLFSHNNGKNKYKNVLKKNEKGQEGLWSYGISGDNLIILLVIKTIEGIDILKDALKAHEYWSFKGIKIDMVILNEDKNSYFEPLLENIKEVVYEYRGSVLNVNGGVFIINSHSIPQEDKNLLFKWSRLIVDTEEGFIQKKQISNNIFDSNYKISKTKYFSYDIPIDVKYFNGYGGFSQDGKEYIIKLTKDLNTPLPWINVIANENFGFIVSEGGMGFTWAYNSRENKLTPWYNDPISDLSGEVIYLRDEETGYFWSITPLPIREDESYVITHGLGYSKFYHYSNGIEQNLTVFVPRKDKIKINLIKIKNNSNFSRKLTLNYYIRPVLGVSDEYSQYFIETGVDEKQQIFYAKNSTNIEFKNSTMFIGSSENIKSYTGDRIEFVGKNGTLKNPHGLRKEKFSNTLGIGLDPCCAIQIEINLSSGEERELVILLGEQEKESEGYCMINKYKNLDNVFQALNEVKKFWKDTLGTIQIKTPDDSMDLILNNWLMYQTIVCRLWSRAGFYQVGGAYGARDQIQDAINCIYISPEITRKQIIRNCRHQFVEGDVQHWWHPTPFSQVHKGIRTRYSDDLLWLPYVVAEYVKITGDFNILFEKVSFIESELLKEGEYERYEVPNVSNFSSTVYEHCIKAIEKSLKFGEKGIPLMGSGDWNDGMNKVGHQGKGESIWLGWFLGEILKRFIPICKKIGDFDKVKKYKNTLDKIVYSIEENAWDGEWYKRAYFDDGKPLGSKEGNECIIDSIAQSWAVISGLGRKNRIKKAMDSVEKYLVKKEEGMILLFTPPFDESNINPGYIKSYVPGVRENGGQYTHAATWVICAFAMMGEGDKAFQFFRLINPVNHTRTFIECGTYKVEPYVVAADVYGSPPNIGRGGWTWYTGSSGWLYKVGIEYILGFRREGDKLILNPCIPKSWDSFNVKYKFMDTKYNINIKNPYKVNQGINYIAVDGNIIDEKFILLVNDGKQHFVEAVLGSYKQQ